MQSMCELLLVCQFCAEDIEGGDFTYTCELALCPDPGSIQGQDPRDQSQSSAL